MRQTAFFRFFLAGLAAVLFGYLALAFGRLTLAPILLVLGYCLLIPWALLKLGHSGNGGTTGSGGGE